MALCTARATWGQSRMATASGKCRSACVLTHPAPSPSTTCAPAAYPPNVRAAAAAKAPTGSRSAQVAPSRRGVSRRRPSRPTGSAPVGGHHPHLPFHAAALVATRDPAAIQPHHPPRGGGRGGPLGPHVLGGRPPQPLGLRLRRVRLLSAGLDRLAARLLGADLGPTERVQDASGGRKRPTRSRQRAGRRQLRRHLPPSPPQPGSPVPGESAADTARSAAGAGPTARLHSASARDAAPSPGSGCAPCHRADTRCARLRRPARPVPAPGAAPRAPPPAPPVPTRRAPLPGQALPGSIRYTASEALLSCWDEDLPHSRSGLASFPPPPVWGGTVRSSPG